MLWTDIRMKRAVKKNHTFWRQSLKEYAMDNCLTILKRKQGGEALIA